MKIRILAFLILMLFPVVMMGQAQANANGPSSTDIMASASTDLFLPGRRTPGTVIIFNYN